MSSLENLGLTVESVDDTNIAPFADCDTEFQHFSESVSQQDAFEASVNKPLPFCFGDTPLRPLPNRETQR